MDNTIYRLHKQNNEEMSEKDIKKRLEFVRANEYMMHLMKCALNNTTVDNKPEDISWDLVYKVVSKNDMQGLTYYAIEKLKEEIPEIILKEWKEVREAIIYKKLMMEVEREEILADLSEEGISFLMLKGCNIEKYYPQPGMRAMADNDILYGVIEAGDNGEYHVVGKDEEERNETVKNTQLKLLDYMHQRGYKTKGMEDKDDACLKDDLYNFEMHRELLDRPLEYSWYYSNPWKNAIKNENSDYMYHFSIDDEYIFMIIHEYKHYTRSGCGVRFLTDIYLFLKAQQENMDWEYIRNELSKLNMKEFENEMRKLALDWLSPEKELKQEQVEKILYMCACGTFGYNKIFLKRIHTRMVKGLAKDGEKNLRKAKIRYFLDRFFPKDEYYKDRYPFFYKHRLFRPLLTIFRCFRAVICYRKSVMMEIENVTKAK